MKKLIIAAVVACAAAFSQAAVHNWVYSTGTIYAGYNASAVGKTSTVKETSTVTYLIYYGGGTDAGITQAKLLEGLRGGKTMADYSTYVLQMANSGSSDAKVPNTNFTTGNSEADGKVYKDEGTDYISAYVAIVDGDYVYLSATANSSYDALNNSGKVNPTVSTSSYLRDKDGTVAFSNAGWYNLSAAPEPTSGLLLLLGVAGLALKRKRA